ncbi:hypothetical protein T265_09391 [Opisthorchis viverrini]|uniref:Uncharacterized protein n=1 Tax=Opisthorchis viverrini TaxID=6198 RepID=A0A074Z5Z0_OPIVI|nr:hypothetical protein T265_09391 [Opisthorchis viverrini]KER22561.1 hypothetical protein T265_09391 [Opisthorchis viverrini]
MYVGKIQIEKRAALDAEQYRRASTSLVSYAGVKVTRKAGLKPEFQVTSVHVLMIRTLSGKHEAVNTNIGIITDSSRPLRRQANITKLRRFFGSEHVPPRYM